LKPIDAVKEYLDLKMGAHGCQTAEKTDSLGLSHSI
jgi:hypothetical protein